MYQCVADLMFMEVPLFQETSPTLKNPWLCACTHSYFSINLGMTFCSPVTLILNVGHLSLSCFLNIYLTISRFLPFLVGSSLTGITSV